MDYISILTTSPLLL